MHRSRLFSRALSLLILIAGMLCPRADASAQVSVSVSAIDASQFPLIRMKLRVIENGARVPQVQDGDMQLHENGINQAAAISCPDQTVSVMLILDKSTSMAFFPNTQIPDPDSARWKSAKSALVTFVSQMAPQDEAGFISFARRPSLDQDFTNQKALLTSAINRVSLGPSTAIWASVDTAIALLSRRPNRRAIVLLTDGEDNASFPITLGRNIQRALQNNVRIFTVGLGEDVGRAGLDSLARMTGGEFFFSATGSDLTDIYESIIKQLPDDCTLSYVSSNPCRDGTLRNVDFTLHLHDIPVSADTFYTAPLQLENIGIRLPAGVYAKSGDVLRLPLLVDRTVASGTPIDMTFRMSYDTTALRFLGVDPSSGLLKDGIVSCTFGGGVIDLVARISAASDTGSTLLIMLFATGDARSPMKIPVALRQGSIRFACPATTTLTDGSVMLDGSCERIAVLTQNSLFQNHPNPFNPSTVIRYFSPVAQECRLTIATITGGVVEERRWITAAGEQALSFDGTFLPAGAYFYRLQMGNWSDTRKMLLVK